MTNEQQKIIDKLYAEWQQTEARKLSLINQLTEADRAALIGESKFKAVLVAFGGENWEWDGKHVRFLPLKSKAK